MVGTEERPGGGGAGGGEVTLSATPGAAVAGRPRYTQGTVRLLVAGVSTQHFTLVECERARVHHVVPVPYQRKVSFVLPSHGFVVVDGGLAHHDTTAVLHNPGRYKHSGPFDAHEALEA